LQWSCLDTNSLATDPSLVLVSDERTPQPKGPIGPRIIESTKLSEKPKKTAMI
jgi:hypothetical protein